MYIQRSILKTCTYLCRDENDAELQSQSTVEETKRLKTLQKHYREKSVTDASRKEVSIATDNNTRSTPGKRSSKALRKITKKTPRKKSPKKPLRRSPRKAVKPALKGERNQTCFGRLWYNNSQK